jgi:hypothetical protein
VTKILIAVLSFVLFLTACQRPAEPDKPAVPEKPDSPAAASGPVGAVDGPGRDPASAGPEAVMPERDTTPVDTKIVQVQLSNSGNTETNTFGMPATRFTPTDSVYAEVQTQGTAASYTLYAKWIGADDSVLAEYGMKIQEAGPKRTVISLSKPDGWPAGTNRIELSINGKLEKTATFEVR